VRQGEDKEGKEEREKGARKEWLILHLISGQVLNTPLREAFCPHFQGNLSFPTCTDGTHKEQNIQCF
jgi:hypothetical protein